MKTILDWLRFAADIIVPRFITEEVALAHVGPGRDWDDYHLVCSLSAVRPGERFDGVATVDSFTWLGMGLTYRVRDFRLWEA